MIEQIVKDPVSGAHDDVADLNLAGVLVCVVGRVLTHIVLACFEQLPQLNAFLDLACVLELFDVLFARQD